MDSIIYHTNSPSVNTFNSNLTAGPVNPLRRVSYRQQININSRFRDNYTITPATDFYFNLSPISKKVVSMKLICINIPNMIYTINNKNGSNNFGISQSLKSHRIYVTPGSYTGTQLAQHITADLSAKLYTVKLQYSEITGRMTFLDTIPFDLSFDYIDPCNNDAINTTPCTPSFCKNDHIYSQVGSNVFKDQMTLGWILGFRQNYKYNTPITAITQTVTNNSVPFVSRKELRNLHNIHSRRPRLTDVKGDGNRYLENNYNCCDASGFMIYPSPLDISFSYSGADTYTAEGVYDPLGNRYFLLSINDYLNNHTRAVVSAMQEETLNDGHILAKVGAGCCGSSCDHEERIYFGPSDISRLHIKLLDEFGRIVDLNQGDFSLTLEFEVLYDL